MIPWSCIGWLSYHGTYAGAMSIFTATAAICQSPNAMSLAPAAPPAAWWLCTFNCPAQRPDIVQVALWGTSDNMAVKRRPSQGAPGGAESAGLHAEVGSKPKLRPVLSINKVCSFFLQE